MNPGGFSQGSRLGLHSTAAPRRGGDWNTKRKHEHAGPRTAIDRRGGEGPGQVFGTAQYPLRYWRPPKGYLNGFRFRADFTVGGSISPAAADGDGVDSHGTSRSPD